MSTEHNERPVWADEVPAEEKKKADLGVEMDAFIDSLDAIQTPVDTVDVEVEASELFHKSRKKIGEIALVGLAAGTTVGMLIAGIGDEGRIPISLGIGVCVSGAIAIPGKLFQEWKYDRAVRKL